MNQIIQFVKNVCATIGGYVNLPAKTVGYIGLGVIALIIVAIIAIIVKCTKKRKTKKSQKTTVVSDNELKLDDVKEEPVKPVEEVKSEQVEIEQPVEEQAVVEQSKPLEEKLSKKETDNKTADKKKMVKKETASKPAKKLLGKWTVQFKGEGEYTSTLSASNGEVMLTSEIYTTEEGARNGIATIIRGVDNGKFVIYQDKNKNYYYKLKTSTNRLLCVGEIYKSKEQCLKAVDSVKRIASGSPIAKEVALGAEYVKYTPAELPDEIKKGTEGKWRVETSESGLFTAKLFASNGQLMLTTEEVSLKKSAENAIISVKKNAIDGNFIIDRDKFGRFYYKLRNAQKSVICIGEAYDTLESCVSAIESVRRFASTAITVNKEN
ncbi:MAG: DUF1508 domain-containing protein [Clostridia bacterium]|nr:DUF1508 domain-containing protein [Clostridia bacterium]